MKFGIVVFPGSNCDEDAYHAAKDVLGQEAEYLWHKDTDLKGADVRDPAGRLRARRLPAHRRDGALLADHGARCARSPTRGGPVLGICNGFQILLEAGLLPGAMLRNRGLKYRCEHVHLRVEQTDTPFTAAPRRRPGAAAFRSATARATTSRRRRRSQQIEAQPPGGAALHRSARAASTRRANPNGSVNAIAGALQRARNVVGMMPHPERACEPLLGGVDGRVIFESIVGIGSRGDGAQRSRHGDARD